MNEPKAPPQPAASWWKIALPLVGVMLLIAGVLWLISPHLLFNLVRLGFALSLICVVVFLVFKPIFQSLEYWEEKRLMPIAAARKGESICTFARAFDCRKVDTWIIRAAYEEIFEWKNEVLPIRPDDDFEKVLRICGEELEEIAESIAEKAGRSFEFVEDNPYNDRVRTVRDLVMFLQYMPPPKRTANRMWRGAVI